MAQIINPIRNDSILASTGEQIKVKIVDIGDWDMNWNAAGTDFVIVPHSLDWTKIKDVCGWIRNDADDKRYSANSPGWFYASGGVFTGDLNSVKVAYWDSVNIRVEAKAIGGLFDSVNFNALSYNRGKLFITYEE